MSRSILIVFVVCGVIGAPTQLVAQEAPDEPASAILEALELPDVTQQLRDAGVDESEISATLQTLRQRPEQAGEKADDESDAAGDAGSSAAGRATRVLREEARTAREHGPMENLSEFVRDELDDGVRGRELADSIRQQRDNRVEVPAGDRPEPGERAPRRGGVDRDAPAAGSADRAGDERPDEPSKEAAERRPDDPSGDAEDRRPERRGAPAGPAKRSGDESDGEDESDSEQPSSDRRRQRQGGRQ